ncbi:ankyrin repeat domain-containing protein [Proteus mirabilis]
MNAIYLKTKWFFYFLGLLMVSSIFMVKAMANSDKADLVTLAQEGNLPELKRQIAQGENIEQRDIKLRTPLMAATHANQIEVAKYLIEQGANVNARDAIYDSPYLYAGARGLQEILALTLAHGADLNSINRYGGTALIPAAERGHVATVKTLIDAGVDVKFELNPIQSLER